MYKSIKCPECGALLNNIDPSLETFYCQYCGTQIVSSNVKTINVNKNINKTNRVIDEAAINRTNKEYEYKTEQDKKQEEVDRKAGKFFLIFFGFIFIMGMISTIPPLRDAVFHSGQIRVGTSSKKLKGKNYKVVESTLEAAGFYDIELIDLDSEGFLGWDKDKVESVSIGGDLTFDEDDYFDADATVIISYH